jgi:hypothetical protein
MKKPELEAGQTLALVVNTKADKTCYDGKAVRETIISIVTLKGEVMRNLPSPDETGWSNLQVRQRSYPEFEHNSWELEFSQLWYVDWREIQHLYSGMKSVVRGLEKLEQEWGRATSLGVYVARLAKVIGAQNVVTWREDPGNLNYDDSKHLRRYHSPGESVGMIDYPIAQWLAEQREKAKLQEVA